MTAERVTSRRRTVATSRSCGTARRTGVRWCSTSAPRTRPDEFPLLTDALDERGWQLVAYARPGYAGSSRHEGRSVADAAGDVATILDQLGLDRFLTIGWSGGGPHALACAALLPDRCEAAASLAGVAPFDADGLEFLAGMGPENVEEFGAAARSRDELEAFVERFADELSKVTGDEIAESLGDLVDDVDRDALTGEFAETLARMLRRAVSAGIAGWFDDDLAFVKPWGFDLARDHRAGVDLAGSARPDGPVRPRRVAGRPRPRAPGRTSTTTRATSRSSQQMPRILDDLVSRAGA